MILTTRLSLTYILAAASLFLGVAQADSEPSVKSLVKERVTLSRAWQLSDNYAKGLTVEADPFKALAWQYVYVTLLPHAYPGLDLLLKPFKKKVKTQRHNEAFDYSKSLKENYQLPSRMDENQLIKVFQAKEEDIENTTMNPKAYRSFNAFIAAVAKEDNTLAFRYKNKMRALKEETQSSKIIFGQVVLNGGELEQTIIRNQPVSIDQYGFFLAKVSKQLLLTDKGYQTYISALDFTLPSKTESLGRIVLDRLPEAQLSSVVGNISSFKKISNAGITLKLKEQYLSRDEPWFTPTIIVTKLENGQFYIKDLAAGNYELIMNLNGKMLHQDIILGAAQVKTLKTINL